MLVRKYAFLFFFILIYRIGFEAFVAVVVRQVTVLSAWSLALRGAFLC